MAGYRLGQIQRDGLHSSEDVWIMLVWDQGVCEGCLKVVCRQRSRRLYTFLLKHLKWLMSVCFTGMETDGKFKKTYESCRERNIPNEISVLSHITVALRLLDKFFDCRFVKWFTIRPTWNQIFLTVKWYEQLSTLIN